MAKWLEHRILYYENLEFESDYSNTLSKFLFSTLFQFTQFCEWLADFTKWWILVYRKYSSISNCMTEYYPVKWKWYSIKQICEEVMCEALWAITMNGYDCFTRNLWTYFIIIHIDSHDKVTSIVKLNKGSLLSHPRGHDWYVITITLTHR